MPFALEVTVEPSDIDNLGHASNIVYLRWVQDVALAHSTALGLSERDYVALGKGWVVRKHEIEYHQPALFGDELELTTSVVTMRGARGVRKTAINRIDGTRLTDITTEWVWVRASDGRPTRVPSAMVEAFES